MPRYFFDNAAFKTKYIKSLESLQSELSIKFEDDNDLFFNHDLDELRNAELINWDEDPKLNDCDEVIQECESTQIVYRGFKSDHGYLSHGENGCIEVPNVDVINFFELKSDSTIIDNLELFHPTLYLQRVNIGGSETGMFDYFFIEFQLEDSNLTIRLNTEHSFLFSYKLSENNHPEPLNLDYFIEIRGTELDLEECRMICKSLIFELNCFSGLVITPEPNKPYTFDNEAYDKHIEEKREELREFDLAKRSLLICKDTEKVIDIFNRANSCNDYEISILYFSKVIEYVSETVVRSKITEVGRKALTSNRVMMPDANFIKELQEIFRDNSFKSDSESMELTVQSCCYINDLVLVMPQYIENKFKKYRQKSDLDALSYLASCISATRNNIAHAKANYCATGNEIPEEHYKGLANLMRVICQQCIRWYAAQSPSMRIVS